MSVVTLLCVSVLLPAVSQDQTQTALTGMRPSSEWRWMDGWTDGGRWWWGVASCKLTDGRTHARTWRSGGRQQHVGGRRERTKDGGMSGAQAGVRCKDFFRVSLFEGSDVLLRCFRTQLRALHMKAAPRNLEAPLINWNYPSVSEPLRLHLCHLEAEVDPLQGKWAVSQTRQMR